MIEYRVTIQNDGVVVGAVEGGTPARGELGTDYETIQGCIGDIEAGTATPNTIKTLGRELYSRLFDKGLRQHFVDHAWDPTVRPQIARACLRLRLVFQEQVDDTVKAFPWESLYGNDQFLGAHARMTISYQLEDWRDDEVDGTDDKELRILFVHNHPKDLPGVAPTPVRTALEELTSVPNSTVHELENPAFGALAKEIEEFKPHVLHFLGHGEVRARETAFAFRNAEGQALWVPGESFGDLFAAARPLLVVLQACEGGAVSPTRSFEGGAAWLARKHVPAVIAMRYPFAQGVGWTFARELYRSLAQREPVDVAVQRGRIALAGEGVPYSTRDFTAPVLWMRLRDGHLLRPAGVQAAEALRGLADVLSRPEVRAAARDLVEGVNDASRKMARLHTAKAMHDLLQQLEGPQANIERALRRVASDPTMWEDVARDDVALQDVLSTALEPTRVADLAQDSRWRRLASRLTAGAQCLHAAMEKQAGDLASTGALATRGALDQAMSLLDDRIARTVGSLALLTVVTLMINALDRIPGDTAVAARLERLRSAVPALAAMENRLGRLTDLHGNLQNLDDELKNVEGALGKSGTAAIESARSAIEKVLAAVVPDGDVPPAQRLQSLAEELGQAMAAGEPEAKVRRAFWRFREAANRYFNEVDRALLLLAEQLVRSGPALDQISDLLGDHA